MSKKQKTGRQKPEPKRGKGYTPKPKKIQRGVPQEGIDLIHSICDECSMIATMKLPFGRCVDNDMRKLQDFQVWTRISVYNREKYFNREDLSAFMAVLNAGTNALCQTIIRFREFKTDSYVTRPQELKEIVDSIAICRDYIKQRAIDAPSALLDEWKELEEWKNKKQFIDYRQKLN